MRLEFGTTDELTNTQFAPVATLMAYYEARKVLEPLQSVTSARAKKGILRWPRSSNRSYGVY